MQKRNSRLFVLIGALLLVLTATFAMAQTESDETSDEKQTDAKQPTASQAKEDVVYTTDYLKERFGEKEDAAPDVDTDEDAVDETEQATEEAEATPGAFTNEDLKERFGADDDAVDEAEEATEEAEVETPPGAFTNEDLKERFGADEDAVDETEEATEEAEAEVPAEPALSPEERAQRISEIDDELERLDKRLLALKNPLLAGTAQPTPEERTEEAGLDSAERLRRTEEKIEELKATLEELRAESEAPPDE